MVIVSWMWYSPSLLPCLPGMYFSPPFSSVPMPGPSSRRVSFRIGISSCAWETGIYPGNHGEMTRGDKGARSCWTQCAEPVQGAKPTGPSSWGGTAVRARAASVWAWVVVGPAAEESECWVKPGESLEKIRGLSHFPNSLIASLSVICPFLDFFCHLKALVLTVRCRLWCVPSSGPFTGVSAWCARGCACSAWPAVGCRRQAARVGRLSPCVPSLLQLWLPASCSWGTEGSWKVGCWVGCRHSDNCKKYKCFSRGKKKMPGSSKMPYKFGKPHSEQLWAMQLQSNPGTESLFPGSFGRVEQLKRFWVSSNEEQGHCVCSTLDAGVLVFILMVYEVFSNVSMFISAWSTELNDTALRTYVNVLSWSLWIQMLIFCFKMVDTFAVWFWYSPSGLWH